MGNAHSALPIGANGMGDRKRVLTGTIAAAVAKKIDDWRSRLRSHAEADDHSVQNLDKLLGRMSRLADLLATAALSGAGFSKQRPIEGVRAMAENHDRSWSENELADLIGHCHALGSLAFDKLDDLLDDHPEIWREAGDLAKFAQEQLLDWICSGDRFVRQCIIRQLAQQRAELLSEYDGPIFRLAVDRVLACRLEVELIVSKYPDPTLAGAERSALILNWTDRAQKRYIEALRCLALLQKTLGNGSGRRPRNGFGPATDEPLGSMRVIRRLPRK